MQVVEIQARGLVRVGGCGHHAAANKAISEQVGKQERREMIQREGLFQALDVSLREANSAPGCWRGRRCARSVGGSHQPASGRWTSAPNRRRDHEPAQRHRPPGCLDDRSDALGLASHEFNFGPSPRELDRSGSPDAASRSSEHDDGHQADCIRGRDIGILIDALVTVGARSQLSTSSACWSGGKIG